MAAAIREHFPAATHYTLRRNFSSVDEETIRTGLGRLGLVLKEIIQKTANDQVFSRGTDLLT